VVKKQAGTIRVEEAPASYYRSSIDSLCSQPTLRNHYIRRVVFSTVKNLPCRGGTVRCFFLDGKCRRHKCFFDLMTRCLTRARAVTHTREHLSPSLRSFQVSVGRATGPYVTLLILLKKKKKKYASKVARERVIR